VTAAITGTQGGIAVTPAVTTASPFSGPQGGGTAITLTAALV